ncbi:MAG: ribonuclease HI [Gammaproteobacteria bacterium]|nr:ribonuclease HI [Gammaproteobacteria bacterium]
MTDSVTIHTDGACRGNPGPGGWGAVLHYRGNQKTIQGFEPQTTNNRMELTAVIEALRLLKRGCEVELVTDSKYVMTGINEWLANWKRNGWKTAARKPVKNSDLWQQLEAETARHHLTWRWVRGHSGDPGNELADQLANQAIDTGTRA